MNINEHFIQQINNLLPSDEASAMLQSIESGDPVVAIRFNDGKGLIPPATLERVPWCEKGVFLPQRPHFTFDPHLHAGSYYVQEPSSMFIYHVIKSLVDKPVKYLDLCAAPGGKTTAALQALPHGSIVVANEIVTPRAQVLRENIIKWGNDNCLVTNDSPKTLGMLENTFDIIATDVPCSGEGMFRKDDEAIAQWSPQLVEQCAARQHEILNDIWPALKPGGLLIYSTCTYNLEENERMALYIANELGASFVEVPVESTWNIAGALSEIVESGTKPAAPKFRGESFEFRETLNDKLKTINDARYPISSNASSKDLPCYRFMPHRTRGEGLFLCVLRKNDANDSHSFTAVKPKKQSATSMIPKNELSWLDGNYELSENNGVITATNKDLKESFTSNSKLHVIKGLNIEVGTIKGNKVIPSHQLAMSPMLNNDAFEKYDVDYLTAIAYLRGEAITIDAPRGFVLITYQNSILGFVNNLGNRANNLYPKAWRILSSHIPDTLILPFG